MHVQLLIFGPWSPFLDSIDFPTYFGRVKFSWRKMAKLHANSGDHDQMLHSVASDLGLKCLLITL